MTALVGRDRRARRSLEHKPLMMHEFDRAFIIASAVQAGYAGVSCYSSVQHKQAWLNPQPPTLNSLDAPGDYFFFEICMTASPMHSHFPLRCIQVSTQPNERLNCFPSLSLPFSEDMPTTVARFGP
jgi:hypothetical protein